jgi:hypothetical protein
MEPEGTVALIIIKLSMASARTTAITITSIQLRISRHTLRFSSPVLLSVSLLFPGIWNPPYSYIGFLSHSASLLLVL